MIILWYAVLIFLLLLIPERRIAWLYLAFSVVFTLNLLAAVPPTDQIGALLPVNGPLGIVGSVAMLAITIAVVLILARSTRDGEANREPDTAAAPAP